MSENATISTQTTEIVSSFSNPNAYINPWMRFFARTFDISVFTCVLMFFFNLLILPHWVGVVDVSSKEAVNTFWLAHASKFVASSLLVAFSAPFWWCVVVEPILLSSWGSTPGKFLFNLHVIHANGERLSYKEALRRSARVWCFGMGLGIPLVSIVTYIVAYMKLKKHGTTSWDKNPFFVKHEPCGWLRKTLITIIFILPMGLWGLIALIMLFSALSHI